MFQLVKTLFGFRNKQIQNFVDHLRKNKLKGVLCSFGEDILEEKRKID